MKEQQDQYCDLKLVEDNSVSSLIIHKPSDLKSKTKTPVLIERKTVHYPIIEQGNEKGKFNSFEFI
jgi:hypothetical protein